MLGAAPRPWRIHPAPLRSGRFTPPGDKSITHRAILLAGVADGVTTIRGANPGADADSSLAVMRSLGAAFEREAGAVRVHGTGGALITPAAPLDCGNSGTTLRIVSGAIAGAPIHAILTGDESLRRRPVDRVIAPLRAMGATLSAREGDRLPPLEIHGGSLSGTTFTRPTASAQVASCILLAALAARGRTSVRVESGVRDHTVHMLRAFGVPVEVEPEPIGTSRITVPGPVTARATEIRIPGDPSAAAFFFAAAAATPGLRVEAIGINLNPARLGLLECLREMGATVEIVPRGEAAGEPQGDVTVVGPARLQAADVPAERVTAMVDEVPAWAIAAAAARGTSRLTGAGELRVKESDRLAALALNLNAIGIAAAESPEGLAVTGGRARGGAVRAFGDHRIAMAFAVIATGADGPTSVDDAAAVATSFPEFESTLRALGGNLEVGPFGKAP